MSKQRVRLTPDEISNQWNSKLKGSTERIRIGIGRVDVAPGVSAVKKQEKMKSNLMKSIDDGTWAKQTAGVSLEDWKSKFTNKVGRIAGGADEAMPKRQAFDTWLVTRLNSVLPKIASMPDLTIEDSINRAGQMIRAMSEQKYRKA